MNGRRHHCIYCGAPSGPNPIACRYHADLVYLDPHRPLSPIAPAAGAAPRPASSPRRLTA